MAVRSLSVEELGVVETDLSGVLAKLDITLSALRDALRGTGDKTLTDLAGQLDTKLSTVLSSLRGASEKDLTTVEAVLSSALGQLDITLTAMRDAIVGTGDKTLTDLAGQLDITQSALRDAILGTGGKTLTSLEEDIEAVLAAVKGQRTTGVSGQSTVGTAGLQLGDNAVAPGCEVSLWCDKGNTGSVAVNIGAAAVVGTHAKLNPGEGLSLKVSNTNLIYLTGSADGQVVYWICET